MIRHQGVGVPRDRIRPDQLPQMGEQTVDIFGRGELALPIIAPGDPVDGAAGGTHPRRARHPHGRTTFDLVTFHQHGSRHRQ